jgi:hypothetical protein
MQQPFNHIILLMYLHHRFQFLILRLTDVMLNGIAQVQPGQWLERGDGPGFGEVELEQNEIIV